MSWVNFYFYKIKWLAWIECLTKVLETILMEAYVHQAKLCLFFPVKLSVQIISPYNHTTITSSTFIGLLQFPLNSETNFDKIVRWCNSNYFSMVSQGSLNEILDDVVQCWFIPCSAFLNALYHDISFSCNSVPVTVIGFLTSISWHTKCVGSI